MQKQVLYSEKEKKSFKVKVITPITSQEKQSISTYFIAVV
jgi:hypothetical protein